MPLIQWNESFSVNVVEIDKQHQKLVGMINDLYDAMHQGKGNDVLGKIIDGLIMSLIEQRNNARAKKDFAAADAVRNRLNDLGIVLEDKPGQTVWRRK